MLIIPAIDIKNGKCVRLLHGDEQKETVYSDDPVQMAKKWIAAGCKRLHVIDLDGAFSGTSKNLDTVVRIKKETGIFVQMGGGIRSLTSIESILGSGIDRVILGTIVFEEAGLAQQAYQAHRDRIMVALDVKDGNVATRGWKESSGFPIQEALSVVEKLGGQEVIFTDIGRDGALSGVNLDQVQEVMKKTKMKVYASGGVSTLSDIENLKAIQSPGCIIGKALYEGKIDLFEALRVAAN